MLCLSQGNNSSNLRWHSGRKCKHGSHADWPLVRRCQVRAPAHARWFIACHDCARRPTLAAMWLKFSRYIKSLKLLWHQICACMVIQTRAERGKKEVKGCVGIAVKALLMHLCSNNHRTWEECSQLLFFSYQTSSSANEQSKQVTHVLCCIQGHQLLLTDLKCWTRSSWWFPSLTKYTQSSFILPPAYTVMECNVIMIMKWSVVLWTVTHFWV